MQAPRRDSLEERKANAIAWLDGTHAPSDALAIRGGGNYHESKAAVEQAISLVRRGTRAAKSRDAEKALRELEILREHADIRTRLQPAP